MEKKLYRDEHRKVLGGVCAGLADYFGYDVSVVRIIFVLALFLKGVGFLPYIVLWIVLPRKQYNFTDHTPNNPFGTPNFDPKFNSGFNNPNVDYTIPPVQPGDPFMNIPPVPKKSNAGAMFGVILIVLGSIFLIDQLDIIPDLDFEKLWPLVLVAVGCVLIFSGKKQPWEKDNWQADVKKEDPYKTDAEDATTPAADADKKDDQSNNNPIIL